MATIPPGESLVLPTGYPIPQKQFHRMVLSYTWSKDDAKRFGCWEGSVGTLVIGLLLSSELNSDK
ncbi:MAG TPA: hypothetical protein VL981_04125 [Candidatus Methylacidiphilales bacterium]|nr:hypothetical protein [Candidatus Methylacidiphilales bacterium]